LVVNKSFIPRVNAILEHVNKDFLDSCACRGAALCRGGSSGEYAVGNTIASEVAFFANVLFRWCDDGEVLGNDLSDDLVEVLRGRVNEAKVSKSSTISCSAKPVNPLLRNRSRRRCRWPW
jgi:hypothetical protein